MRRSAAKSYCNGFLFRFAGNPRQLDCAGRRTGESLSRQHAPDVLPVSVKFLLEFLLPIN